MTGSQSQKEQAACLSLKKQGKTREEIARQLNMSVPQVKRRLSAALKADRLDPELAKRLAARGITDLAGLHSGWLMESKISKKGSKGSSLYFYLGPDQERIDFAEAVREVLSEIPRLPPLALGSPVLSESLQLRRERGEGYANWIALADLHVGGDYGSPQLAQDFNDAIDDLVQRMPPAEKAVLFELGDLLDANDHKGVTPASGNPCDVKRDDHLATIQDAIRLIRRAAYRLAETHDEVEIHLIKGNHDPTAYFAVMLALAEHFADVNHIRVVVSDDEYRVISWGKCAAFPHHGDTLKWSQLKDVFADQFPDEWAAAKTHRHIMTAHYHHERRADMVGCVAEQFRTIHRPNGWAKGRGMFAYGSLTALTVHRDRGEEYRTISNIRPLLRGKVQ